MSLLLLHQISSQSVTLPDALSVVKSDVSDHDSDYRKKYEEGFDIYTDDYLQWIRDNNLTLPTGDPSTCTFGSIQQPLSSSNCGESTSSSLSEILALPKPLLPKRGVENHQ